MQQGGEQHLALLPKPRPTPVKSLSAPALICVMLYVCYVNGSVCCLCPAHLAPQGLKNNSGCSGRTFGCPAKQGRSCSIHKRVTGFRKHSWGGKGWGESHLQPGRRAGREAEERSAGARSSALATLPKQLPPGLELPPLCKHRHQLPALMEQIGLKGKQSTQRKQHMVIGVDLLGETCSCSRCSQGKFCL